MLHPEEALAKVPFFSELDRRDLKRLAALCVPKEFRSGAELLEEGAVDVVMPDLQKCGGLGEGQRIANLAQLYYVPFAALVIVGSSNAVNLTDGLDGLAIGPVMMVALVYMTFCYVAGNVKLAEYLQVPHVAGAGEVAVFCGALVAAGLGFRWFNAYPAQMFLGDVGSLSLGAALGALALISRQELVLVIAGGVFVAEALSVILQVASYKLRRRRIFRMAPIHHHFELLGWPEPQIIVRFWILSILCALFALSTLKLR